jgi:hypothetical protein
VERAAGRGHKGRDYGKSVGFHVGLEAKAGYVKKKSIMSQKICWKRTWLL